MSNVCLLTVAYAGILIVFLCPKRKSTSQSRIKPDILSNLGASPTLAQSEKPGPTLTLPWLSILILCRSRVLLYAKMLKETKTEETIDFVVTFLSLVSFQLVGRGPPSGYA